MRKILFVLLTIITLFTLTACGNTNSNNSSNGGKNSSQKENKKEENNQNNNIVIDDDEIIEFDDEDNPPIVNETVNVKEIINCDNCVFAYFTGELENAKKIGDTVTSDEYTNDIRTLKTAGGKQRHNFFGLVLDGNKISKAYACILKDNKIYCIQGSTNGAYHSSNIGILNQIFTAGQCKTISAGHTYTCTDGNYNGDTITTGFTSLHYETSCVIYGSEARTGQLTCH